MEFQILSNSSKQLVIRNGLMGATSLNQEIGLFDYGNVIVQKDYTETGNVRIVSGGSYYMGDLVGKGMLTAAIQGEHNAPPSNIILRTLHELGVNHILGSLIIIPCDTGCTLNFGLAVERALNNGLRLKMLSVADGQFNERQSKTLKQSLGGIILLYKIAGAMSCENKTLSEIHHYCEQLCANLVSSEIEIPEPVSSGQVCSCVCAESNAFNTKKLSEVNLPSIRGKVENMITIAGYEEDEDLEDFRHSTRLSRTAQLQLEQDDSVVVLINNNLALSKIETYYYVKDILEYLNGENIEVVRFYVNDFMKVSYASLSITLMKVINDSVLTYLDAACTAPGWIRVNQGNAPLVRITPLTGLLKKTIRKEAPIKGPQLSERATNILLFCMQFACNALISCERQLNIIDSDRAIQRAKKLKQASGSAETYRAPDGDTGTRMKNLADLLIKRMKQDKVVMKYPYTFFDNLSKILEKSLGGSSGCIYSILFEAMANVFGMYYTQDEITPSMWLDAFESGTEALKRYGNIDFGDGTMYDPIYAFCKHSRAELVGKVDPLTAFGKGLQKAEEAIEATKKDRRYPDPGAHSVGIWMRAIYEGVKVRWPN